MERIRASAEFINQKLKSLNPKIAIITGSGLSSIGVSIMGNTIFSVSYNDIPHFPSSAISGHQNKLIAGFTKEKIPIICLLGRVHGYEGHDPSTVAYSIRVLALLGIETLIVTNASGSLLPDQIKVGDIMVIKDHISLSSLTGNSPLRGENLEEFGPRFPSMTSAYNPNSFDLMRKASQNCQIPLDLIKTGIYFSSGGPQYETPAEARMLRNLGASAVGMSTVPEVIVAVHCGLKVIGLSLITNEIPDEIASISLEKQGPTHEEVLKVAKERLETMSILIENLISLI